jgi:hypothetical protein
MGMAKLNVWISELDAPCSISDRTWYVTIYECNGDVLRWCRREYAVMPARCGHLEVEIPPGCYYIKAVWGFRPVLPGIYWANHFTDTAIVQAGCDEKVCVRLFNPSVHRCGYIFLRALRDLVAQKAIKPEVARQAEEGIEAALQQIPRPIKRFELGHIDEIERLVQEQEREGRKEQKKDVDPPGED